MYYIYYILYIYSEVMLFFVLALGIVKYVELLPHQTVFSVCFMGLEVQQEI